MIKKKEYVQFLEEILVQVEARYHGKVKGEICTSIKNNGVAVTGLMLKGEERVAPNFYLDKQFIEWMRGLQTLEDIVERLCEAFEEEVQRNSHLISKIQFSWEEFRRNVFMRLVNREKNQELLEGIPHKEFMDLAVVYYYSVPISGSVLGTMVITMEHLKLLGITEEELHRVAKCNCERFQPVKLRCMEDVVYELGRKIGVEVREASCMGPFLYVLTNTRGMFGAIAMTFEKELDCFSKRINNSFYILPSSVHEVILVPACKEFCVEYFANMVREINETQVEPTEVLSNSIYYYDKELKNIRRVV
ncbi:MAG: hypothetical protein J6K04_06910 [Lachnospiraceae bacterium]|nr:hypothetical protein [Lachnospiraceae bacterium]